MDATLITFGPGGASDIVRESVATRKRWNDAWKNVDFVDATEAVWSDSPTLSTATLLWDYGDILQLGDAEVAQFVKDSDLVGSFVRVKMPSETTETRAWYGVIDLAIDRQDGLVVDDLGPLASGQQKFTCYGMEKLLVDHQIDGSFWDNGGGAEFINRPLVFNFNGKPNRAAAKVGASFLFSPDPDASEYWSSRDIVEYLLERQTPLDSDGGITVAFSLDDTDGAIPDWDRPEMAQRGTTFSLLNRLIDRRRLLAWRLVYDGVGNKMLLQVSTYTDHAVTIPLPDATPIPANGSTRRYNYDADQMTSVTVKRSQIQKVHQVISRSDRIRSVGTHAIPDNTLERGFSTLLRNHYNAGGSTSAGYGALEEQEKEKRNAEVRGKPELDDVYTFFRIPKNWDRKVAMRSAAGFGGPKIVMFPDIVAGGDIPYPTFFPEMFVEPALPLLKGVDYSGSNIADGLIPEPRGDDVELAPLVFFRRPDAAGRWVSGDRIAEAADVEVTDDEERNDFSVHVDVPPKTRGIRLITQGAPRHAIAASDFVGLPVDEYPGGWDFDKWMVVTLSIKDDQYVEGRWPSTPIGLDVVKRKLIDAGDAYKVAYVTPGTVVGLSDNGNLLESQGGYTPANIFERLQAIAKVAAAWYTVDRFVLTLISRRLKPPSEIQLGDMVTEIGDPEVAGGHHQVINSPVTQIKISMPRGEPDAPESVEPEMTVTTWAGELDAIQALPPKVKSKEFFISHSGERIPIGPAG